MLAAALLLSIGIAVLAGSCQGGVQPAGPSAGVSGPSAGVSDPSAGVSDPSLAATMTRATPASSPPDETSPTASTTELPTLVPGSSDAAPWPSPSPAALKPAPGREFFHGDLSKAEVFITIDDCRNWKNIDLDLEAAHAAGIQVTLFPAGRFVDAYRQAAAAALQKAISYSDEIDNHTYVHESPLGQDVLQIKGDLDTQLLAVRSALNDPAYREWFVRPPYGLGFDDSAFVTAAWRDDLAVAGWSIDSSGYEQGSTVAFVLHNVFETGHFRNGAIILLHDDDTDTAALPLIIDGIYARGLSIGGDLKNILASA